MLGPSHQSHREAIARAYGGKQAHDGPLALGSRISAMRITVRTTAFKAWFGDWEAGSLCALP